MRAAGRKRRRRRPPAGIFFDPMSNTAHSSPAGTRGIFIPPVTFVIGEPTALGNGLELPKITLENTFNTRDPSSRAPDRGRDNGNPPNRGREPSPSPPRARP